MITRFVLALTLVSLTACGAAPQRDRDARMERDRKEFPESAHWIYDDFEKAVQTAKTAKKPLLAVLRCVP